MKTNKIVAMQILSVLLFGVCYAEQVSGNPAVVNNYYVNQSSVDDQNSSASAVNVPMEQMYITAEGEGVAPDNITNSAQKIVLAKEAAYVEACAKLYAAAESVMVKSAKANNLAQIAISEASQNLEGVLKNVHVIKYEATSYGSYKCMVGMPKYGENSFASAVFPTIKKYFQSVVAQKKEAVVGKDGVDKENVEKVITKVIEENYSGIIVDGRGLGLETTMAPILMGENLEAVYGAVNVDIQRCVTVGMVEYAKNLEEAKKSSRAGKNPLIVKGMKAVGGVNSANPVNVILSNEDAKIVKQIGLNSDVLKNGMVVVVRN